MRFFEFFVVSFDSISVSSLAPDAKSLFGIDDGGGCGTLRTSISFLTHLFKLLLSVMCHLIANTGQGACVITLFATLPRRNFTTPVISLRTNKNELNIIGLCKFNY